MRPLIAAEQIEEGVSRVAREIQQAYAPESLTLIGVMTGSLVFLADLMRKLDLPLHVEVIRASSYRGGTTSGELVIDWKSLPDVSDQHVVLVDDIFDTGKTISALSSQIKMLNAKSVASAVLLCKQGRSEVELRPDFVAFEVPDLFVVGYGLDYRNKLRHLPYVAVLEPEDLQADASSFSCDGRSPS